MKKFIILFIVHCSLFTANCLSQSITWQRLYNGPYNQQDICTDLCLATNGNFYAIGVSKKPSSQGYFIYALKINPYGDTLWTRIIDSVSNEARSCAESGDGGVVIVGEGSFALKLDSTGNILWKKFYSRGNCYDIIKTSDGGYLACGDQLNITESGFHYDSFVMKLDPNGNLQWDTLYISGFDKPLFSVQEINGEGYIYTGYVENFYLDTTKCLILKTDYNGNIIWEKNIKIFNSAADGKKIDKLSNNFLVVGSSTIGKYFMKINSLGNIISIHILNESTGILADFKLINSNRYALTAYWDNIVKSRITDSLGNIIFQRDYSSPYYAYLFSILPLNNGDIIWGGVARFTIEDADVWLIRSDSMLNAPPIGIYENTNFVTEDYLMFQNYPNPFNPITKIKFLLRKRANVKIIIYNVLGEKIEDLIKKELNAGEYAESFNGTNLPSGIYFYQLSVDNTIISSKKMILLK